MNIIIIIIIWYYSEEPEKLVFTTYPCSIFMLGRILRLVHVVTVQHLAKAQQCQPLADLLQPSNEKIFTVA